MFDSLHEECGVFGIFENQTTTVAQTAYLALFALQHRGQESCGIAVNDDGVFRHHRGDGLVPDVFSKEQLAALGTGNMAIGHVRYSTTGGKNANTFFLALLPFIAEKGCPPTGIFPSWPCVAEAKARFYADNLSIYLS